ncbi:MAG: anaerobic ribonucleoside-triphosphate reductase activating protein [Bacteroidales bacterium]|nr:anaerobic ribonucleoside-triphosphate reductase activating protein [Bacteroidales bacterium]
MKKPILNLSSILQDSHTNGPGNRDVIWVQGCSIRCHGCFNQHLWNFDEKFLIPVDKLIEKFKTRIDYIEGVSILGGEPIHQSYALSYFLKEIKNIKLTTVVYTGFTHEHLIKQKNEWIDYVLKYTDILIDGAFNEEKKDINLIWRGSTNQRILFLSDEYSEKDIPKPENYINSETHLFNSDNIEIIETGIK